MFAGGSGAVGLLPPPHPPHAISEPIAAAIASRFIVPPDCPSGSVRGPCWTNPSRRLFGAEHDAPDARPETKQSLGADVVEVAEQHNARAIGGKHGGE